MFSSPGDLGKKQWILLRKKRSKELSVASEKQRSDKKASHPFQQKGPYSTQEIREFLKTGLCSSRDFVWTEGFKEWKRISLISSFPSHPRETIEDTLTYQQQKNTSQELKILRYSPIPTSLDWSELSKSLQNWQK